MVLLSYYVIWALQTQCGRGLPTCLVQIILQYVDDWKDVLDAIATSFTSTDLRVALSRLQVTCFPYKFGSKRCGYYPVGYLDSWYASGEQLDSESRPLLADRFFERCLRDHVGDDEYLTLAVKVFADLMCLDSDWPSVAYGWYIPDHTFYSTLNAYALRGHTYDCRNGLHEPSRTARRGFALDVASAVYRWLAVHRDEHARATEVHAPFDRLSTDYAHMLLVLDPECPSCRILPQHVTLLQYMPLAEIQECVTPSYREPRDYPRLRSVMDTCPGLLHALLDMGVEFPPQTLAQPIRRCPVGRAAVREIAARAPLTCALVWSAIDARNFRLLKQLWARDWRAITRMRRRGPDRRYETALQHAQRARGLTANIVRLLSSPRPMSPRRRQRRRPVY